MREREGARGKKSVTRRVRRGGTAGAYREGLGRRSAASAAAQRQRQRVEGTAAADGGEGRGNSEGTCDARRHRGRKDENEMRREEKRFEALRVQRSTAQ